MIFAFHGVSRFYKYNCLWSRNLLSLDHLANFVKENKGKISPLDIDSKKIDDYIYLTFDDNTNACYEAASFFANENVPATWFVNSDNMRNNTIYSASLLNSLIDSCQDSFIFNNIQYNIKDYHVKKKLRKIIKEFLHCYLSNEHMRNNFLRVLAQNNNIHNIMIPDCAQTVSKNKILEFMGTSVSIMNHCYNHDFTDNISIDNLFSNLIKGKDYLEKIFNCPINHHALPYGLYSTSLKNLKIGNDEYIYLLDSNLKSGYITSNIINRETLKE